MGVPGHRRQRELPSVPGDACIVGILRHDVPGVRDRDWQPAGVIERRLGPPPSMPFSIGVNGELPGARQRERRGGDSDERAGIGLK